MASFFLSDNPAQWSGWAAASGVFTLPVLAWNYHITSQGKSDQGLSISVLYPRCRVSVPQVGVRQKGAPVS